MVEELLKVRSLVKKRKPTYRRQQSNQFAKFKNDAKWRKPKGHQSKIRLRRRGHQGMPEVGYGSPKAVRGLNKEGLREVIVKNVADLKNIQSGDIAVIGGTVGGRKRLDILTESKKLKVNFANVKDIDATIKSLTKAPKKKEATKKVEEKKAETTKKSEDKKEESKK